MKKIGLGISILLFAVVLELCSSGLQTITLLIAIVGLIVSVLGFVDK